MKTPEQWADESWHDTGRPFSLFIRDVQNDARAGMIEASELDPVIDLLESVAELAPDFLDDEDGHFSKETQPILDRLKALRNEHTS